MDKRGRIEKNSNSRNQSPYIAKRPNDGHTSNKSKPKNNFSNWCDPKKEKEIMDVKRHVEITKQIMDNREKKELEMMKENINIKMKNYYSELNDGVSVGIKKDSSQTKFKSKNQFPVDYYNSSSYGNNNVASPIRRYGEEFKPKKYVVGSNVSNVSNARRTSKSPNVNITTTPSYINQLNSSLLKSNQGINTKKNNRLSSNTPNKLKETNKSGFGTRDISADHTKNNRTSQNKSVSPLSTNPTDSKYNMKKNSSNSNITPTSNVTLAEMEKLRRISQNQVKESNQKLKKSIDTPVNQGDFYKKIETPIVSNISYYGNVKASGSSNRFNNNATFGRPSDFDAQLQISSSDYNSMKSTSEFQKNNYINLKDIPHQGSISKHANSTYNTHSTTMSFKQQQSGKPFESNNNSSYINSATQPLLIEHLGESFNPNSTMKKVNRRMNSDNNKDQFNSSTFSKSHISFEISSGMLPETDKMKTSNISCINENTLYNQSINKDSSFFKENYNYEKSKESISIANKSQSLNQSKKNINEQSLHFEGEDFPKYRNSREESKFNFPGNTDSIEDIHFVFVKYIQRSKSMTVAENEHPEKDLLNNYNTVTKYEEVDI